MIDFEMPGSSFEYLRRRRALHLFRLSNRVLRIAISLHHTQSAPRASVRVALSAFALLEKDGRGAAVRTTAQSARSRFDEEYEK